MIHVLAYRRRYERAEKEFIAAKLSLHEKRERKELLTEHLCKIISENEQKKAEKLTQLMRAMNLEQQQKGEET